MPNLVQISLMKRYLMLQTLLSLLWLMRMIWGIQFVEENRNRCEEQIETFVILLRLSEKRIPKRIRRWKLEIGPTNYNEKL